MNLRLTFRILLGLFFVVAGANHFRDPAIYLGMMPAWLPSPSLLIEISGAAEILGGIGVLIPATRQLSGWALIILLIAIFPANLQVAIQGHMPGFNVPPVALWLRLPFQLVLIAWVWWCSVLPERIETLD